VAFLILVSSTNVSPLSQTVWLLDEQLQRLRAPDGVRQLAVKAVTLGGFDYLRYDTVPALRRVPQPVLALYGSADAAVPVIDAAQLLTRGLEQGGNDAYTIRYFAGADHGLRVRGGGLAPGYLDAMASWVTGLPSTSQPRTPISGAPPVQRYAAGEVPPTPWYATAPVLLGMLGLAGAGYAAGPAAALLARVRGGRRLYGPDNAEVWAPLRRGVRRLAWSGIVNVLSLHLLIGLIAVLALLQSGIPVIVQGAWLVVRLIALLVVVLEVVAIASAMKAIRDGWRPTRVQRATLIGVTGGTALLLLNAAYFGLFSPSW
jgi:hypothetical protein